MSAPNIFYWDFFGPQAPRTAEHFQKHLLEFLSKHDIPDSEVGTLSAGPGHCAAYCKPPAEHWQAIAQALRPQRAE